MTQGDRDTTIQSFKKKEFPILVATDVAGEGRVDAIDSSPPYTRQHVAQRFVAENYGTPNPPKLAMSILHLESKYQF